MQTFHSPSEMENEKMKPKSDARTRNHEPLLTIPAAAGRIGIPTSTLRRAVNAGLIPSYQALSARRRVRLSEVVEVIEAHQTGGQHDG